MAQWMPLPLTVSCFSKIQISFSFLVPADLGSPGQRAVKRVCVCVLLPISVRFRYLDGATENARHENTGGSKMQGWKMRDMNLRHQLARVENARHENAAPCCRGGKCET